jgi:ATP-dependent exoDNAse (exonuclease V) beta subunit
MRLEFPHIFVYEASAGSGKTRKLAERYIDFLLNYSNKAPIPFNFRNVLAITFTNEAADQMRQEILKMLKARAIGRGKESSQAMQIVDEIIQNFSDFAVRTIDSFVHSLLVASSLELKLPPDYEISPQPRSYLEYVLDAFLDEVIYNRDINQLFLGFLNHFLVVEGQRHWNPKRTLLSLLIRFYREENSRAKLFKEISNDFNLSQTENELKDRFRQFLSSLSSLNDVDKKFIRGLISSLDTSGAGFLKGLNRYINKSLMPGGGILNKKAKQPNPDLIRSWEVLRSEYDIYAHAFVWLRYNFYLKIFSQFRQRIEDFKQEKRIVFLDELNKKARQFLTSEGLLPAEIYYKLSLVLYHYLIDEFQDTSILQWENIQALVEDALSKGGSLFYVGDKKQAIYRFRGGEVELFDLIKTRFRNQVARIYDEALLRNYRSREVIVEFNNSVFNQENLRNFLGRFPRLSREFQEKILTVFKDSQQNPGALDSQGGYVRLQMLEGENRQNLQDYLNIKVKETIIQLRERFNYKDILILVRDNQEAENIAGFLLEQRFPICASRTISIRHNYLIRQIINLLKFLNSPIDNLCFANFILGEVFTKATGLNPEKLQLWLENLRINEERDILYTKFRSTYPLIWQKFFQYLFNAVGFLPVYDLVESILIKFKIEDNFPHLLGFTQRLLEILHGLAEHSRNSLADFLEWFESVDEEDLFVRLPSGLDAIKILTIHKAKGLTSPVVILPYAVLEIKVGEVAFEAPKIVHETPDGLYLLYPQKEICQQHPELAPIYQREYFQALLDELNCLYVATTRAASELYIFLPKTVNRNRNPLVYLLLDKEQNLREFGSKVIRPVKTKHLTKKQRKAIISTRALSQVRFHEILKDQLIHPEQIVSLEKRHLVNRGDALHYLLAEIDPREFIKNSSSYAQRIKDACYLFNYPDSEEITQCLLDFFNDTRMQKFFNPEYEAFNEKEVVDRYGNLKRIDRLVMAKDKIWIIDYKTGEGYQQEHQRQVREYAQLINELYPDRLPECWLIYVDTQEVHLVNV